MTLISKLSEDEVMQNLKKRFANDSIYTYIGDVLISVNPFRFIPGLTSAEMIESYKGKFTYEVRWVEPFYFAVHRSTKHLRFTRIYYHHRSCLVHIFIIHHAHRNGMSPQ